MMGYFCILIVVSAGLIKGWSSKKAGVLTETLRDGVLVNLVRMAICAVIGAAVMLLGGGLKLGDGGFWIYFLSAAAMAVFAVSWLAAVKLETYMFLSIFTMLGSVVSTVSSAVIYGESIAPGQWLGIVLLLVSTYVMSLYNRAVKGKLSAAGMAALITCGLSSGMCELSQKIYMKENGAGIDTYNFLTYTLAAAMLALVLLFMRSHPCETERSSRMDRLKMAAGFIVIMSICLYVNSFFKTMAAGLLPANRLYPVTQGLNLIGSALMARICFGEKIKKHSVIGMAICFCALILLNL